MEVILDKNPIYIKTSDIPEVQTRKAFIRNFLRNRSFKSYDDLLCTTLQCSAGRNRSVTEIYRIVLSRFPKTSFENILKIISELIDEDGCFYLTWCTQIKKVVVLYKDEATRTYTSPHGKEKYYTSVGVDGYSLKDYEEIINKIKKK